MNFSVNTICKQYGIPQCVHCPNVPGLCFDICPDDCSFRTETYHRIFNTDHYIFIVVLLTAINHYIIAMQNGMSPIQVLPSREANRFSASQEIPRIL